MLMAWNNRNLPLHNGVLLLSCMARGFTSTGSSMRLSFLNLGLSSMQVGPSHVSLLIILNTGLNNQAEDPAL